MKKKNSGSKIPNLNFGGITEESQNENKFKLDFSNLGNKPSHQKGKN